MHRILGIDHVVMRARDLELLVGFYRDVVGCSVDKRIDRLGLVHLRAGSALIDLISVDGELGRQGGEAAPAHERHNLDHLCLRVEPFDIEAITAWLARNGVVASGPKDNYGAEGDGWSVYFDDPEGNTIEFKGSSRPATH